jgi:hypothetical protein
MNKATPAKPNSRTKTGAHRPFESENQRLSGKTIVHYSLLIVNLALPPGAYFIRAVWKLRGYHE